MGNKARSERGSAVTLKIEYQEGSLMAIKLFQSQTSMFCEKVRIVLAMKKVPYDIVDVRKDDRKSLIEYTGQRKVPSMNYNGNASLIRRSSPRGWRKTIRTTVFTRKVRQIRGSA